MAAAAMLNLFLVGIASLNMPSLQHSTKFYAIDYFNLQLRCRNKMRFKMEAMLDFRKSDY